MTANHAHTPTDYDMQEQFEAGAMVTGFAHSRQEATIDWQLWLQERDARITAAAEQRGAIKELEIASKALKKFAVTQSSDKQGTYIHAANMLLDRALHRADQMEGDDD